LVSQGGALGFPVAPRCGSDGRLNVLILSWDFLHSNVTRGP